MNVGILALQGAFAEHAQVLERLGVAWTELRQAKDLQKNYDGIILPGGESTVQGKLLKDLGMFQGLQEQIKAGLPVLATCAGMILLASEIEGEKQSYLSTIPMCVKRNAYGRQLGSFHTEAAVKGLGTVPMTFIRAPYVKEVAPDVEVLSTIDDKIVGVRYHKQLAFAFHPELDTNTHIHEAFLALL